MNLVTSSEHDITVNTVNTVTVINMPHDKINQKINEWNEFNKIKQ